MIRKPKTNPQSEDPSPNVLDLVRAAEQRQDDLREQEARHQRERFQDEVRHNADMRLAEARRLDARREVDISAAVRASETATATAATLAAQVARDAETMRGQREVERNAGTEALVTAIAPLSAAIAALEAAQHEQQGGKVAHTENRGLNQWAIGFAISLVLMLVSIGGFVITAAGFAIYLLTRQAP